MVHDNEVVMLVLGIGVYLFVAFNKARLIRIPAWNLLINAYRLLLAGWALTVLEGFVLESLLNHLEHFSYACGAVLLALWLWKITRPLDERAG